MLTLKQKALSGVKWTTLSTVVGGVLQLAQLFILARLLSPSEFGVIAIIMIVVGFSQIFMDMGISNGIIHKQDVTHNQLSTLYWLNVLSGIFLFTGLNLLALPVANFYEMSDLTGHISILSFVYLIIPFGQQFMILLQKEMQFNVIAKIDITAHSAGFITTVGLATIDYGILSFVYGAMVFFIVRTVFFVVNGFKDNKPSLYFKPKEAAFFLKFGMYQMGEKLLNYLNTEMDVLIIGKVLGPQVLGLYSIIKQLILRPMMLINPIITKVSFPLMAKVQHKNRLVSYIYHNIINSVTSIMFPIYLSLFFMSHEVITLFLGSQWLEAELILKILSLYAIIRATGNPVGALLLAKGRADIGFFWNLSLFFVFPVFIYIGALGGIFGVSISLLGLALALFLPNWYFQIFKVCNMPFKKYLGNILLILKISTVSSFIGYIFQLPVESHSLVKLTLFLCVSLFVYWVLVKKYNSYFYVEVKRLLMR